MNKEIQSWLLIANYKTIVSYLNDNKSFLVNIISKKDFNNDFGKIKYFSVIIKNNIITYKPIKEKIVKTEIECYENKYRAKRRRKCLNDYKGGE